MQSRDRANWSPDRASQPWSLPEDRVGPDFLCGTLVGLAGAGPVESCVIITTTAKEALADIQDRISVRECHGYNRNGKCTLEGDRIQFCPRFMAGNRLPFTRLGSLASALVVQVIACDLMKMHLNIQGLMFAIPSQRASCVMPAKHASVCCRQGPESSR